MCMASFKFAIQVNASKAELQESCGWQMLSTEEAVSIVDQIHELPSVENFISILQKCRKKKDLACAKHVHAHICNNGLEAHKVVGNHIVPMFVECGSLLDAQHVFNRLIHRNEHSWTSLILGYIQCGKLHHALTLYQKMQEDNVHASSFTFVPLLKACATLRDVEKGQEIHADIARMGLGREIVVGNSLISMYAKCGSLSEAQEVFDKLPVRDVVSWNALIAGFVEYGPGHEALKNFEQMQQEGILPNVVSFVCTLKACRTIGAIGKGKEIHRELTQKGFERNCFVSTTLVDMYANEGSLLEARKVFDNLSAREVVSWTALIAGYAEHGPGQEALKCFDQMQLEYVSPNPVTFVCALKACCNVGVIDKGQELHMEITRKGYETDRLIGNALVYMYVKCGSLVEAREVFAKLPVQEVVSWTALIAGYAEHTLGQEVIECFEQMQLEDVFPDAVTLVCILKACSSTGAIDKGREIYSEVIKKGFDSDSFIGNALVDMYTKCGSLLESWEVFVKLPVKEVVSWTALISGFSEHGPVQEALKCLEQMLVDGTCPNSVTFACALKACARIGAIEKGREIHQEITQKGLEGNISVGNTLIDMYAKCGLLSEAWEVFAKLPVRDVVSWNALIAGCTLNHEENMALQCFENMQEQTVQPDAVTFTCLLTACSHASLIFEGQKYFEVMREQYGIAPTADHYACVIDLLARSGLLCQAEKFLETIPCPQADGTWRALLSGCKTYGVAELGQICFEQLVQMNSADASSYMLMVDTYVNGGRWDDAFRVEELRRRVGAKKKAASAVIEVNKKIHEFVVGDSQSKEILAMLEVLQSRIKEEGQVPNLDLVVQLIPDFIQL